MPIIRDIIKKENVRSRLLHDLSFARRCKCRCWKRRSVICCGKWTSWARRVNGTRAGCIGTVASRSRNSVAPSEIWGTRVHRRGTWERCAARWHGTSVFRTSRYAADFRFTPIYRRGDLLCSVTTRRRNRKKETVEREKFAYRDSRLPFLIARVERLGYRFIGCMHDQWESVENSLVQFQKSDPYFRRVISFAYLPY